MTDTVNKQDDIVRGALGWTLATLIQVVAGTPVKNLDEVIVHAEAVLSTTSTPVQGYREALEAIAESDDDWYVGRTPMKEYARQALSQTDIQPSGWYCARCKETVPPENVTYDERHDERSGGCGMPVNPGINSTEDDQPCKTCHGVGAITRITGSTPESYSEENMPCPDCTEDDQPGPSISSTRLMVIGDGRQHRRAVEAALSSTEEEETDA